MQPQELVATIARNIRARRKELRITQAELAKLVEVNQSAISQFESGKNCPPIPTIAKLADALETVPDFFLRSDVFLKTPA